MNWTLIDQLIFFPIRHHSPRSSHVLLKLLEEKQPKAILVEGPSDATEFIDVMVDRETQAPIAILAYRHQGETTSTLWPFADYSPEWQALHWAHQHGCEKAFIDIPSTIVLANSPEEPVNEYSADNIYAQCASKTGHRSFEEFWESSFEAPDYTVEEFHTALVKWADLSRVADYHQYHRARDVYMLNQIESFLDKNHLQATDVVVVLGAAHVAAILQHDVKQEALDYLPKERADTKMTLIPYSYPRLAEQLGYGAGNRAPYYYQRVHENQCDYYRGTLEVMLEFAQHLRLRGFSASLADSLEAYRLAICLSQIRDKLAPGLDELKEATVATLCRGNPEHVDSFLWPNVVGKKVGKVARRIGRNSLQEEFWYELDHKNLPADDELGSFVLKLNNELEISTSIFLHRLRIVNIPYASYMGSHTMGGRRKDEEEAGGYEALRRIREAWEAQWTPATDVALLERIALGDSLQDVTSHILLTDLEVACSTGQAAQILLEAVVSDCPDLIGNCLEACDHLAANDDDLPSLAQACRALSGLVSYGSSRSKSKLSEAAIETLCLKTFDRALLRIIHVCNGDDDAIESVLQSLAMLHEIALAQTKIDKEDWVDLAKALLENFSINPMVPGLVCGLLYLSQDLKEDELKNIVSQRLSNTLDPFAGAGFLSGILRINPVVLLKNRPLVSVLDDYIVSIPQESFKDILPMLRRALSELSVTERRYLIENILAHRQIGKHEASVATIINEKDKENLKGISSELDDALDDLDDLL